jgi:hypothetical protein
MYYCGLEVPTGVANIVLEVEPTRRVCDLLSQGSS